MKHLLLLIALAASAQQIKINPITGLPDLTGSGVTAGTGLVCVGSTCSVDTAVIQSRATEQAGTSTYLRSTTGNDTYTGSLTPTLTAYTTGMCLLLNADTANTGAATINVDALGAKSILGPFGSALADGDIPANQPVQVCYNGTAFIKQGPSYLVQDATPTTGDTKLVVKAGAGQASNLQEWQLNNGSLGARIDSTGNYQVTDALGNGVAITLDPGGILYAFSSTSQIAYMSDKIQSSLNGTTFNPFAINASTTTIQDTTATTGATLVDIVAGASQTTKSVVLQAGGRIKAPLTTPTTSAETCTAGTFTADTSYVYVCTAANTWKRAALSAF